MRLRKDKPSPRRKAKPAGVGGARFPSVRLSFTDPRDAPMLLLLLAAIILGGGIAPFNELLIELIAVAILALAAMRFDEPAFRSSRMGWIVVGLILLLAVYQLAPLSYDFWRGLPGRGAFDRMYAGTGVVPAAVSFSLDRSATVAALLKTLPGLAAFIVALSASARQERRWVVAILLLCMLATVQGMLQLMEVSGSFFYVANEHFFLLGPFSNHNHASDLFLIGAILLTPFIHQSTSIAARMGWIAAWLLFLLACVMTGSRFGIVLAAIPPLFLIATLRIRSRSFYAIAGCVVAGGIAIYLLAASNENLGKILSRFSSITEDMRPTMWSNSFHQVKEYWPIGSGIGTFVPVYQRGESLSDVFPLLINHAHSDFIEIVMEIGALGLLLIILYSVIFCYGLYRMIVARDIARCSFAIALLLLIFHSIVDYPLRNLSLMVLFGTFNGLIFSQVRENPSLQRNRAVQQ